MQSTKHKERMKEKIWSAGGGSLGLIKQIQNVAWFLWTSGDVHPQIICFFFPLSSQLRIRMACPRGVTISSHVSAVLHTRIRRVLLPTLPAYFCLIVLIVAEGFSDSSLPGNTFDFNRYQMLLLVRRNQFSSFPTKRLDGCQMVNAS
jgi:hypothetical protein